MKKLSIFLTIFFFSIFDCALKYVNIIRISEIYFFRFYCQLSKIQTETNHIPSEWVNDNCDILLVSSFEVTNNDHLLPTSEPFKVVSYQHSISCIDTLSVGFPAVCLLRQNRSIGRKVQTSEFNMVDETVALDAF